MAGRFGTIGRRGGTVLAVLVALASMAFLMTALRASPPVPASARPAPAARAAGAPQPVKVQPAAAVPAPAAAAADERFVLKRVLELPAPLRHGDYYWDEAGVPDGPIVITVDLKAQSLSVFRDGYEIGTSAVMYGADEKPTPLGVFPITQKDAHHVSNLYNAPMPYMLRLTNDGVSIHGSPKVVADGATHGCVGVPIKFAQMLFKAVRVGDKVIVTNGKMLHMGDHISGS